MEGLPAGIHRLRLDVTEPASIKAAVEQVRGKSEAAG